MMKPHAAAYISLPGKRPFSSTSVGGKRRRPPVCSSLSSSSSSPFPCPLENSSRRSLGLRAPCLTGGEGGDYLTLAVLKNRVAEV